MIREIACGLVVLFCVSVRAHADLSVPADIVREIERGQHPGVESLILSTNGEIVARYVAPKLRREAPDLRSATKSITALLVGIAIDRGEIPSVRSNVAELLPRYAELLLKDSVKAKIAVEDLLTMRSGLACNDWDVKSPGHEDKMYKQRDWGAFWAKQPVKSLPGEHFSYCTGNVIALGLLLENVTGMPVDQYAAKYLFEPLGIASARWDRWDKGKAVDTGGHLRLAPEDLLRIGEVVLARGQATNARVVSEAWIARMTTPHTAIPDTTQQYGYLWWVGRTTRPNLPETPVWWAQGNGGNLLVVMPGVQSVFVVTGTRFNRPDALEPLQWLRDRILPAMAQATADSTPTS